MSDLAAAGLWISSLWLVVYAAKYSFGRPRLILPSSQSRRPVTEVAVKHFTIRLKTEAFNTFHDELSSWLSSDTSRVSRRALLRLYDLGSFVGVVGMLLGFCLLFITVASLALEILHAEPDGQYNPSIVAKRGLDYATIPPVAPASDVLRISPIIPGLTVPLSHLPLIFMALTISQVVHEAGHAVAAALHRIPVFSCGVAVTFLFPSAFVALPAARLQKLPPRDRLQIVSGGCLHNFLFSCLLLFVAWSRVGLLPTWILFRDISAFGRLVIGVEHDSPLSAHLPVGTLVTKIDDFSMASVSFNDPWNHYLLSPPSDSLQGWCTNKTLLEEASACTDMTSKSCFVSKENQTVQYESDAVDVFANNSTRCNFSMECSLTSSCVVPRHDQQLVRISVLRTYAAASEDTIVWKGPKKEIWEQVQVGILRSRFLLVSPEFPRLASIFFEYMKIANLSLYLVNMLPITALDGYQSLVALLQLFSHQVGGGSESIDLEALNSTRPEGRLQSTCRTLLSSLALLLVALSGLLGTISWLKK